MELLRLNRTVSTGVRAAHRPPRALLGPPRLHMSAMNSTRPSRDLSSAQQSCRPTARCRATGACCFISPLCYPGAMLRSTPSKLFSKLPRARSSSAKSVSYAPETTGRHLAFSRCDVQRCRAALSELRAVRHRLYIATGNGHFR